MSLLTALPNILEASKKEYESAAAETFTPIEVHTGPGEDMNRLARGDNLSYIRELVRRERMAGKFQLIYIDPPFFSQVEYGAPIRIGEGPEEVRIRGKAYSDTWERGMAEYLSMLCPRLYGIRELLSDEGCLWIHLDWHSVHYVKVMLDQIFGEKRFVNEVVWTYKSGGTSKRHFARKHDTLLFYAKSGRYYFHPAKEKSYNRGLKPYRFKGVREYRDQMGWYTLVNQKDVWQLDMVGRTSGERTGYATQKPEALLRRILESCTRPGDLCGDFFCGSGTLAAAAEQLGRRWICCDRGDLAVSHTLSRMAEAGGGFTLYGAGSPLSGSGLPGIGFGPPAPGPSESASSEGEGAPPAEGRISFAGEREVIALEAETTTEGDDCFLVLRLTGFFPEVLEERHAGQADRERVEALQNGNALELIGSWSVDFHYDGKLHRGRIRPRQQKRSEEMSAAGFIDKNGSISVRIRDIFGREYQRILEVRGGKL